MCRNIRKCVPNCVPNCIPNFFKGCFWALLGGYLLGLFSAPLEVAIKHKKTPKKGVFIRVLVIIRVYIPANGNYFYLNGSYWAITR
nr:MAG TPA: hypothetical protein [Caudoviricetes sp.]